MQPGDYFILTVNRMSGGQQQSERLAAQYIGLAFSIDAVGRVRLAASKLQNFNWPFKPGNILAHPIGELRFINLVSTLWPGSPAKGSLRIKRH